MSKVEYYIKNMPQPMVRYEEGMAVSEGLSISAADKANGSPKDGDMIATNPNNPNDQWLISKDFFEKNYVKAPGVEEDNFLSRLEKEHDELLEKYTKLSEFQETEKFKELTPENQSLLNRQCFFMMNYLQILIDRLELIKNGNLPLLTFGQKAVGLKFNPSFMPEVDECKTIFALAIDQMHQLRIGTKPDGTKRHASTAITMAEDVQMRAVKAIIWKED